MAWLNASIIQRSKCCDFMSGRKLNGNASSHLFCRLIAQWYIPQWASPLRAHVWASMQKLFLHPNTAHDPSSYHGQLQAKLARLPYWKRTSLRKQTIRISPTISMSRLGSSKLGILYGCPFLYSRIFDEKENWCVLIPEPTSYTITSGKRVKTAHAVNCI